MTRYRDSRTGKFVSAATWKRSKAHGGTRYVRTRIRTKAQPARPAKPITKRKGTSDRAKKGRGGAPAPPQPETIMYLVTVEAKSGQRTVKRDLLIPARRGTKIIELRRIAQNTLSASESGLAQFIRRGATIAEGPPTRATKAQIR